MSAKKDVQESLVKKETEKVSEEEFLSVLKMIAPGTNLRTALEGALKTGKGALIVIDNDFMNPIIDGGFKINCKFTPQKLVELSKIDGAIILSNDIKKINYANVLLTPDSRIKSGETGTRHKAAERTAKQARTLAIAISERRKEITVFYKNIRYLLQDSSEILRKANEHIQIIEKQRELFDNYIERLSKSEIQKYSNLSLAVTIMQKGMLIQKISGELKKFNVELGKEGALLKIRLREIKGGVEKETDLVIKDYTKLDLKKSKLLLESLSYDEILDEGNIYSALAYESTNLTDPIRGWRVLSHTSLDEIEVANVLKKLRTLDIVLTSPADEFVESLGEEKAKKFKGELDRLKPSS